MNSEVNFYSKIDFKPIFYINKNTKIEKIPSKSIDQGGRFDWIVKLNPNRFAQRPDAEFTGSFRLTAPAEGGEGLTSVRAVSQGPGGEYEIELLFRVE